DQRRSANGFELSRKLQALLAEREKQQRTQRIVVPVSTGDLIIEADEVDWIEADDYYAAIHTRKQRHLVRESLTSLAHRLDPTRFIRVHRSAIVNIDRVIEVRNANAKTILLLTDGTCVPVSRRRRSLTRRIVRRISKSDK